MLEIFYEMTKLYFDDGWTNYEHKHIEKQIYKIRARAF